MSFLKGFIPSLILSFLAFSLIILYGGSFALSLIEEKENSLSEDDQQGIFGPEDGATVDTLQNTFSFALVITDEPSEDEEDEEENEDIEGGNTDTDPGAGENPDIGTDPGTDTDPLPLPEFTKEFENILADDMIVLEKEVKFICVVHINATVSKSFITVIPGDSLVTVGGVDMPLSYAVYFAENTTLGLEDYISSTVIANTGIIPDFYGSVDIDDFVELADELEGLKYENEYRITTELKRNGKKITVPVGNVSLTADTLSALLEYDEYPDKYRPSQILTDISKIMLDGICKQFKPNIISKVRSMLKYVETDFTANDMSRVSSVFFSYEGSEKTVLPMLGAYENIYDDFFFRINGTASIKKFKEFLN
ncbi:MAG: hypothetical protein E7633_04245 [Ruminococcaceae bacterium]|nr:hypothetical protein [Oscillospiraceae bacterium]